LPASFEPLVVFFMVVVTFFVVAVTRRIDCP